jgi:hypothetical protein
MAFRLLTCCVLITCAAPGEAQTLSPPSGEPPSVGLALEPPSAKDLTEGDETVACEVQVLNGERHSFTLRHVGARGYKHPKTGKINATEARISVVRDGSQLFQSYSKWRAFGGRFEAHSDDKNATFGPHVRLQMERTDFDRDASPPSKWAILVQAYFGWMPLTKAVGYCDVKLIPQPPLSDTETREYLKL